MKQASAQPFTPAPVAVGGVGGSGTRLIAEALRASGIHMGSDLNSASDTLWFTLLFKRLEILDGGNRSFDCSLQTLVSGLRQGEPLGPPALQLVADLSAIDRAQHSASWLAERAKSLIQAAQRPPHLGPWGWKEPNTHLVIDRLWERLPELRYVHVVRHGVDMAYSANQNQLQLWGEHVLGTKGPITPQRSLAYWCRVHQRMQALQQVNPTRMFWLDFDRLCRDPTPVLSDLSRFLGFGDGDRARLEESAVRVRRRPVRHLLHDTETLGRDDIAYVRSLGYAIGHGAVQR